MAMLDECLLTSFPLAATAVAMFALFLWKRLTNRQIKQKEQPKPLFFAYYLSDFLRLLQIFLIFSKLGKIVLR